MDVNKKESKVYKFFILQITLLSSKYVETVFDEEGFVTLLWGLARVA